MTAPVLDVCCVKAPGYGDVRRAYLEDIAIFSGATFVTDPEVRALACR